MSWISTWPLAWRLLVYLLAMLASLLQMTHVVILMLRRKTRLPDQLRVITEVAIAVQLFSLVQALGYMQNNLGIGINPSINQLDLRLIGIMFTIMSQLIRGIRKQGWLIVGLSIYLVPILENLLGWWYPIGLIAILGYWSYRALQAVIANYQNLQQEVSVFSIKQALDNLTSGILVTDTRGKPVFMNRQMDQLLEDMFVNQRYRLYQVPDRLLEGDVPDGIHQAKLEGERIYTLPNGQTWQVSSSSFSSDRQEFHQLLATNVTEKWQLTSELQATIDRLEDKSLVLKDAIKQLELTSEDKVIKLASTRTHDVLGQKLAWTLGAVRGEHELTIEQLRELVDTLIDDLKSEQFAPNLSEEIRELQRIFEVIGVEVELVGDWPTHHPRSRLIADIMREGTTNAVRHGFASHVTIELLNQGEKDIIRVTNNGYNPKQEIKEGSGLSALRKKLIQQGGEMLVTNQPQFMLTAVLAKEVSGGTNLNH